MAKLNSVLLTYKGKVMLVTRDILIDTNQKSVWGFIGEDDFRVNSLMDILQSEINFDTKLKLADLSKLKFNSPDLQNYHLYHMRLTDENVNCISRHEGRRLEFYSLKEAEKLTLTKYTNLILKQHGEEIKALFTA